MHILRNVVEAWFVLGRAAVIIAVAATTLTLAIFVPVWMLNAIGLDGWSILGWGYGLIVGALLVAGIASVLFSRKVEPWWDASRGEWRTDRPQKRYD